MTSSKDWHSDTKQVRAGLARTENRETSETLFLNSGYVYDSAEQAAAAFKGEADNFIYSRYRNPTLQMAEAKLASHNTIKSLQYPGHKSHTQYAMVKAQVSGFGSIISVKVRGGRKAAFRVLNSLKLIDVSNNLGDAKTLACHPASTTHANQSDRERAALSISESHIRLSVGLEHIDDLWRDLRQALDKIAPAKMAAD